MAVQILTTDEILHAAAEMLAGDMGVSGQIAVRPAGPRATLPSCGGYEVWVGAWGVTILWRNGWESMVVTLQWAMHSGLA